MPPEDVLDHATSSARPTAPPRPARGLGRAIASLRGNRPFLLLWLSNLFFFGGAWTQTLILGWLVFETTGSEFLLAVFTAVRLAPLLLGPLAGVLSDRFDRMRLLLVAGTWAFVAVAALAAAVSLATVPYWALLVGGLAIGLAQSPSQPARSSLVLDLVGRDNLSNANALNSMAMNMTQVIGPAIGGALISTLGAPAALWISSAWYAVSLALLWPLRRVGRTRRAAPEAVVRMLVGGFRTIAANRLASAVLLVTLAANILIWPVFQSFMPVFAGEVLSLDASGLGWLLTCSGIGGLVGSIVIAALGDFRFKGGLFVIGTGVWGALWALFALSHSVGLSFALMAGIGLASAAFGVLQTTLLLMTTEPAVHGRALGLQELAIGAIPVASLALGAIAEVVGVGATSFVSALLLVAAMALLAVRVPQLVRYSGVQE
ncbi:major facilitator superfamily MFS_1 [Beutenbergia cavernae DSM 12333]|uniref:Major facilitator superfamily MFS_1 n=1 Tax=Beutenbergia cavernae (strain ATCC BAA-8 / DSM 12333 / CCUG 43141 / JCM 11478 / NBRC 16432 / NCIMB 13614 / HKI 0122) TaxID=471853 RepID=C5C2N5_BEUC1|nr:MFS transporter [Beutenbergia cavernae]ACQ79721.1 major facilitator superfamily MFS_1 [Beutenbergia cavernae DSM 12333]